MKDGESGTGSDGEPRDGAPTDGVPGAASGGAGWNLPGLPLSPADGVVVAAQGVVTDALAGIRVQVAAILVAPVTANTDEQSMAAVAEAYSLRHRLDAACSALVRDLDSRPGAVKGSRSGAGARTFLMSKLHRGASRAGNDVAAARALDPCRPAAAGGLPRMGAALAAGRISREHVDVGVRMFTKIPRRLLQAPVVDGALDVSAEPPAPLAEGSDLTGVPRCDSMLQLVLLSPTGAVQKLGREARTVNRAQRRALVARDRGCVVAGCHAPPSWCQAHHVRWCTHANRAYQDSQIS